MKEDMLPAVEVGVIRRRILVLVAAMISVAAGCAGGTGSDGPGDNNNGNGNLGVVAANGRTLYHFVRDAAPGDLLGRGGLQGAFDVFDPTAL